MLTGAGFANYTSANGVPVMFRLVGTDSNARLTVESGGVNATSSLSDLGASDGILHIIDRVLGMPFNTIYEKLINNPMLNETFKIGSQGGTQNWNSKLLDKNKRYTFFAPSNTAWMEFDRANPSEFKQLDQGIYPSISRAVCIEIILFSTYMLINLNTFFIEKKTDFGSSYFS